MNTSHFLGRIVSEPEQKQTQSGMQRTVFRAACNKPKRDGEAEAKANFVDIVIFDEKLSSSYASHLVKGASFLFTGKSQTYGSKDEAGNSSGRGLQFVASSIQFCDAGPVDGTYHIAVLGRLTKDCDLSYTTNGTTIAEFCIAENYGKDKANFFDVRIAGKQADSIEKFLRKGQMVFVYGTLESEIYQNKDGKHCKSWRIERASVELIGKPREKEEVAEKPQGFLPSDFDEDYKEF